MPQSSISITPAFLLPLFLGPQDRINKMVNKHSIYYHPYSSRLVSRIYILSYFYKLLSGLSLSRMFIEFFLKPIYSIMVGKFFEIYGVKFLENTLTLGTYFTQSPSPTPPPSFQSKFSPRFLSSTTGTVKSIIAQWQGFFLFLPTVEKGGGKYEDDLDQ